MPKTLYMAGMPEVGDVVRRDGGTYRVVRVIARHGGGVGTDAAVVQVEETEPRRPQGLRLVKG